MATLKELREWVSRDLDQRLVDGDVPTDADGTSFWTRADINYWLNEAYRLTYARLVEVEAPWLTVEKTGTYTANSRTMSVQALLDIGYDPLKITGVYDITGDADGYGDPLASAPYQQFGRQRRPVTHPTTGLSWAIFGHSPMNIAIYPRPTTALTLRMQIVPAKPPVVVNLGGEARRLELPLRRDWDRPVAVPDAFHEVLSAYAVVKAKEKEESDPSAHRARYQELMIQLLQSAEERQGDASRHVFVVDGADYDFGGLGGW